MQLKVRGKEGSQLPYGSAVIIGLTKALAKELASRSIRVNCICPGFIETAMTDAMTAEQKEATLGKIPLARMGLIMREAAREIETEEN